MDIGKNMGGLAGTGYYIVTGDDSKQEVLERLGANMSPVGAVLEHFGTDWTELAGEAYTVKERMEKTLLHTYGLLDAETYEGANYLGDVTGQTACVIASFVVPELLANRRMAGPMVEVRYASGEAFNYPQLQGGVRLLPGRTIGELNAVNGNAFQDAVFESLGVQRQSNLVTDVATRMTVNPDFPIGSRFGVTDVKDWVNLYRTDQTTAFYNIARGNDLPFNLIISPRTLTLSRPLQLQVSRTGGIIVEYDAASGTFRSVVLNGNKVAR